MTTGGRRGRPRKIQPDDVIDVATDLIDDSGLEAFSLRRLAAAMDVRPMAFYTHFESRDALLDAVADRFLRVVDVPTFDGVGWDRWLIELGEALRRAWTAHPRLAAVAMARADRCTAIAQLIAHVLTVLRSAGVPADTAHSAWHAVQNHVYGEVQQEAAWGARQAADRRAPERRVAMVADPSLSAVLVACEPVAEFRAGLELIVAGLRAHRATPPIE